MDNENLNEQIKAMRQSNTNNDRHREYWTKEERKSLEEMYEDGVGISEIAITLERSEAAIFNQIRSMGLVERTRAPKKGNSKCLCPKCPDYQGCKECCKKQET